MRAKLRNQRKLKCTLLRESSETWFIALLVEHVKIWIGDLRIFYFYGFMGPKCQKYIMAAILGLFLAPKIFKK